MIVLVVAVPLAVCMLLSSIAPYSGAWLGGEKGSLWRVALWVGPQLAAATAGLVVTGLLIAAWLRGKAENRLALQQVLISAAGPLPGVDPAADWVEIDQCARSLAWKLPLALAAAPFVFFAISRLLRSRWPAVPASTLYTGVLAVVALAAAATLLRAGHRHSAHPGARAPQSAPYAQALWTPAKWILYLALLFSVARFVPLGWIDRIVPIALLAHLLKLAVLIVLVTIAVSARTMLALLLAKAAWGTGDYDRALARLRWLSFGRPTVKMLEIEGLTHGLAGRAVEAERCLREALARDHMASRSDRIGLLSCLGEALADQGRFEEAQRCTQAAVDMGDNIIASSRADLAELLLKQGVEPHRALDLIDEAMRLARGPVAGRVAPSRWAHRAWALALLGRRQEAEQDIQRAFQRSAETYAPLLANTHWTAGMALLAMEQTGRAIEHFRSAREAEPKGKYGALALQQLNQHSP